MAKGSTARGYGYRWQQARIGYLSAHPLCAYCAQAGKAVAASVVDHIIPHKGNMSLFWDRDNWQPLCKPCHDSVKAKEEGSGKVLGCDANGLPLWPAHHWAKG
jgi:5-methylcytosine-specific restriction protein A